MAKMQFTINEPLTDALKMLMIIDGVSMGESIRRSIVTQLFFKQKIRHGYDVIVRSPETGEETVITLR